MFKAYSEYEGEKNVVLVRGDIVNGGLSKDDATETIKTVIAAYTEDYQGTHGPEAFNHRSAEFNVEEYIERLR